EGVARGKLTDEERAAALARVEAAASLTEAVRDADLVIEAVPERADLKLQVLEEAERHAPPHVLLATNTSSLSVTELQSDTRDAERVLGMHFFNPVHINRLVEVV